MFGAVYCKRRLLQYIYIQPHHFNKLLPGHVGDLCCTSVSWISAMGSLLAKWCTITLGLRCSSVHECKLSNRWRGRDAPIPDITPFGFFLNRGKVGTRCRGGVVVSVLACRSGDPLFDFARGDCHRSQPNLKKMCTRGFPRRATRQGFGFPTSKAMVA